MILISHRGNINGKKEIRENDPVYIDDALSQGFDVEVDVWVKKDKLWLGHDNPQYQVDLCWFVDRLSNLWVHCKNVEALLYFKECKYNIHYFWHESDKVTITSNGFIWAYPTHCPIKGTIAVMPELYTSDIKECIGICSDFVSSYKL